MQRQSHGRLLVLIVIALLLVACSFDGSTPISTPESIISSEVAPTKELPTSTPNETNIPTPSPVREIFMPNLFDVEILDAQVGQPVEFFDDIKSLPSGMYMLYLRDKLLDTQPFQGLYEVRYATIDGAENNRILSIVSETSLVGITNDIDYPLILMAEFKDGEVIIREIDFIVGTVKTIRATGGQGFSESIYSRSSSGVMSFSPDGRWLVWDCEPEGKYAWCLIDLDRGEGVTIVPGGEVNYGPNRGRGDYKWHPDGNWFLAVCQDLEFPSMETYCVIDPEERTIQRWEYARRPMNGGSPSYRIPSNAISPDGELIYILKLNEESALVILGEACILEDECEEISRFEIPPAMTTAVWSYTIPQLALSHFDMTTDSSGAIRPGLSDLNIYDIESSEIELIYEYGLAGLSALGWSPNGKWIALRDNHHVIYLASLTGSYWKVVPETPQEDPVAIDLFLGWLVIP